MSEVTGKELLAFIEVPKGSRSRYEFDDGLGAVVFDRFLSASLAYPTDYGYLIGYRGHDGDPLDCCVCVSEPTFPGCIVPVKPIAVLRMRGEGGSDDKVICVPLHDPGWNDLEGLADVRAELQREIGDFFVGCRELEGAEAAIDGWYDREQALEVLADGQLLQREYLQGKAE